MYRTLTLALAASIGLTVPATAAIVNFEYTVTSQMNAAGTPKRYDYAMRFFIDLDALEASGFKDTFGIRQFKVNVGAADIGRPPPPFGRGFVTIVPSGWETTEVTGLPNFDRVTPEGVEFWKPTEVDNEVQIFGVSDTLADMTWNWEGREDIANFASFISGTPGDPRGRLTASPLTPVEEDPIGDSPAPIPLPAGLPLLLAALGGLAIARKPAS